MQKELGDNITHKNIKDYLWKTLKSGQVVPGFVADCSRGSAICDEQSSDTGTGSCGSPTRGSSRSRSFATAVQSCSRVQQFSW